VSRSNLCSFPCLLTPQSQSQVGPQTVTSARTLTYPFTPCTTPHYVVRSTPPSFPLGNVLLLIILAPPLSVVDSCPTLYVFPCRTYSAPIYPRDTL